MTCSDRTLPTDDRNLCLKAARLLQAYTGTSMGAAIHLDKHVPYGAGLGSGSSDAATTLMLLNRCWELGLSDAELHTLAAQIGSDVPFFLGPDVAYATGRGEVLEALHTLGGTGRYQCPFAIVVVMPPVVVSTVEAYAMVRPHADGRPDLPALVGSNDLSTWKAELVNDFEAPIAQQHPEIGVIRDQLYDKGAGYAALSGSGAAVFGMFESKPEAERAARQMADSQRIVWVSGER
jgi:4-diphosphocytidyl-2-C-methyl-D-erythritol kinase